MSWQCPCGDENQDVVMVCSGCGVEITEEDLDRLMIRPKEVEFYYERPKKIEPTSEIRRDLKHRFGGLIFGTLLAIVMIGLKIAWFSSWQIDSDTWKFYWYMVIAFGICGFIFGEKFFNKIMKIWNWFHHL